MSEYHTTVKDAADIVSVVAAVGSFLELFTPVFGLIGAVWTVMRIAEMFTGKSFHELIGRKKDDNAEHK